VSNIIFYDFRGCWSVSVSTAIVIQCLYLCRMAFRFLAEKIGPIFCSNIWYNDARWTF